MNFAASKKEGCNSSTVTVADGLRVTAKWQCRTSKGWTTPVTAAGTFVVDCPADPPVAAAISRWPGS